MAGKKGKSGRPKGSRTRKNKKPAAKANIPTVVEVTDYPRLGKEAEAYGVKSSAIEELLGKTEDLPCPKKDKSPNNDNAAGQLFELKVLGDFLKLPFAFWAGKVGLDELKLTDEEAVQWAEPTKVLLDHYLPVIPAVAYAWFAWSVTTLAIMNKRFEAIEAERKRRKKQSSSVQPAGGAEARAKPVVDARQAFSQGGPEFKPKKVE